MTYGHTVTDAFHANRLIGYLRDAYQGGPIVVGSDRFEQGKRGRPAWLKTALAACEGPPVEVSLALAHWLTQHGKGSAENITMFTPAGLIAEDAGEKVVGQLLDVAGKMGFGKEMFFANHGRMPNWGLPLAEWSAETVKI